MPRRRGNSHRRGTVDYRCPDDPIPCVLDVNCEPGQDTSGASAIIVSWTTSGACDCASFHIHSGGEIIQVVNAPTNSIMISCTDLPASAGTLTVRCVDSSGVGITEDSCDYDCGEATPLQIPGDVDGSSAVDLTDILLLLGFLFIGDPVDLPCGDGSTDDRTNRMLFDADSSGMVDFTDGIHALKWLLIGGAEHVLGTECLPAPGCPGSASACK